MPIKGFIVIITKDLTSYSCLDSGSKFGISLGIPSLVTNPKLKIKLAEFQRGEEAYKSSKPGPMVLVLSKSLSPRVKGVFTYTIRPT